MNTTNKGELDALLAVKRHEAAAKFTKEKKQIYAEGISSVSGSGVLENALNKGQKTPDFTLKNALGKWVSLYDELKNGPVVLTWYRGGWCPYCNITLHYLQQKLPQIQKAGATLIALTPELPDNSLTTSEKNNLEFTVLSDVGNVVGKKFGVVYTLTDDVASMYEAGFGLSEVNGDHHNELPLAATYVIDTNAVVQFAFLNADYTERAEVSEIVSVLNTLA